MIKQWTIFALLVLAFFSNAGGAAQARPFGQNRAPVQALPLAEELPPTPPIAPGEVGLSTKIFHRPGVEGVRLDWCAEGLTGCGPPAATLFCQWQGYNRAISMVEEQGVGLNAATRQIKGNAQCTGRQCNGFLSITCSRN